MSDVDKALAKRGYSIKAKFLPKHYEKPKDAQLNWWIELYQNDQGPIVATDYHQGIGYIKGYKHEYPMTAHTWEKIQAVCSGGYAPPFRKQLPTVAEVLSCLVMDADALNYRYFEDWAESFGYDTDSRKAEATYRACLDIGLALQAELGREELESLQELFKDY